MIWFALYFIAQMVTFAMLDIIEYDGTWQGCVILICMIVAYVCGCLRKEYK